MTKSNRASRSEPLYLGLQAQLTDPDFIYGYLNECLSDDNPRVFLSALDDIIKANNLNKTKLAKQANITLRALYKVLSEEGNPTWATIHAVLNALGYQLQIGPKATQ